MPQTARERDTVIVDVTYMCNAECRYCQWGDAATPGRAAIDLDRVLIPAGMLRTLGTRRVVVSGGEPMLHPRILDILRHYADRVDEVVIITNGYALDKNAIASLLEAGATGITVSLDSVDPMASFMTRRTPPMLHRKILRSLRDLGGPDRWFELGINSTVSSVTANWITVKDLLEFGRGLCANFVKFQPVFDDGYVSANSAELLLGADDVGPLLEVASRLHTIDLPPTNPAGFWTDVAELAGGGRLSPAGCALNPHDAVLTGGGMSVCYWVGSSRYAGTGAADRASYDNAASRFGEDKRRCRVGFHCFCNQGLGHTWQSQ